MELDIPLIVLYGIFIFIAFLLICFPDPKSKHSSIKKNVCPSHKASFLSKLFHSWFSRYLWENYKKPIGKNLWDLDHEDCAASVAAKLEKRQKRSSYKIINEGTENSESIQESQIFNQSTGRVSVCRILFKTYKIPILIGALMRGVDLWMTLTYPIIFSILIAYMNEPSLTWNTYACICAFGVNAILNALVSAKYLRDHTKLQSRVNATLVHMIYQKILRTSDSARRSYTTGELVNILTTDADRIVDGIGNIQFLWAVPVHIAIAFYFAWRALNSCVIFSIAVLLVTLPISAFLFFLILKNAQSDIVHKSTRGKFIQDLLAGIKILKMYAWEENFLKKALSLRKAEVKQLQDSGDMVDWLSFVYNCTSPLMAFASYATYQYFTSSPITIVQVYVGGSFFATFKVALNMATMYCADILQEISSMKRIDDILNLPELDEKAISHDYVGNALLMKNATFSWTDTEGATVLRNLNLEIKQGTLVTIVGPTGAGKSSLISAFIGELHKISGYVNVNGKVAYVPQQAWILNATFKDNIKMGAAVDNSMYKKILKACSLDIDLGSFPAGDSTEIGEKGINLSGGQKQRINIARAICCNADIFFFDDSLSAVDVQVARHIFEQVLGPDGILKQKTRVLITHNTAFLSQSDLIIALKDGSIVESGTFQELTEKDEYFSTLLAKYVNDVKGDDSNFEVEQIVANDENEENGKPRGEPDTAPSPNAKLIEEELLETTTIKNETLTYFLSAIGYWTIALVIISIILSPVLSVCSQVWLLVWLSDDDDSTHSQEYYLLIYLVLGLVSGASSKLSSKMLTSGIIKASSYIYRTLLSSILHWPLWLLDSTPVGRTMNRLVSDITIVDDVISKRTKSVMELVYRFLTIVLVTIYIFPGSILIFMVVFALVCVLQIVYRPMIYQLWRLHCNSRSPLSSHFIETVNGLTSIRTNGFHEKFVSLLHEKVDLSSSTKYPMVIAYKWISVRIEVLFGLSISLIVFFILQERSTLGINMLCFGISYIVQWTKEFQTLLFLMFDLENGIVAVERIKQFSDLPQEKNTERTREVSSEWPHKGEIKFAGYKLRYRQNDDLMLKGLTFSIESGEKIGVIGRTGAGKSSLILALLRLVEPADGTIFIDKEDIREIELRVLRSRLTIIPQDSVLFLGTLRFNLDPTEKYNDEDLWSALEKSHLKAFVQSLPNGLQTAIEESGGNLSCGQKQLLCLARALLRKSKILILDEATASVDVETDELIQKTIRREFSRCTVLTVAHRLNTIQDYDRILVLDNGNVIEFDTPENLLKTKTSMFYGVMLKSGLITK